jgi:transposase
VYGPRPERASKLAAFKPSIEERLKAGVWNAWVLLRELRARGFSSGYPILKD